MSTESRAAHGPSGAPGPRGRGLAHWIPELYAALQDDPDGAGARMSSIVVGRSARITLDDDVVLVSSVGHGALEVRPDDRRAHPDGTGRTSTATVLAVLDGRVELNQVIIGGDIEIRSSIDDALWMYHVIELLLDGASRVPRLRDLTRSFVGRHRGSSLDARSTPVDWRTGNRAAEEALLDRLGLLEDRLVDRGA